MTYPKWATPWYYKSQIWENESVFLSFFFFFFFGNSIWKLFRNMHIILLWIRMNTETMDDRHLHEFVALQFVGFCSQWTTSLNMHFNHCHFDIMKKRNKTLFEMNHTPDIINPKFEKPHFQNDPFQKNHTPSAITSKWFCIYVDTG